MDKGKRAIYDGFQSLYRSLGVPFDPKYMIYKNNYEYSKVGDRFCTNRFIKANKIVRENLVKQNIIEKFSNFKKIKEVEQIREKNLIRNFFFQWMNLTTENCSSSFEIDTNSDDYYQNQDTFNMTQKINTYDEYSEESMEYDPNDFLESLITDEIWNSIVKNKKEGQFSQITRNNLDNNSQLMLDVTNEMLYDSNLLDLGKECFINEINNKFTKQNQDNGCYIAYSAITKKAKENLVEKIILSDRILDDIIRSLLI